MTGEELSVKEFLMVWLAMLFFFFMVVTGLVLIFGDKFLFLDRMDEKRLGWEDNCDYNWGGFS